MYAILHTKRKKKSLGKLPDYYKTLIPCKPLCWFFSDKFDRKACDLNMNANVINVVRDSKV